MSPDATYPCFRLSLRSRSKAEADPSSSSTLQLALPASLAVLDAVHARLLSAASLRGGPAAPAASRTDLAMVVPAGQFDQASCCYVGRVPSEWTILVKRSRMCSTKPR